MAVFLISLSRIQPLGARENFGDGWEQVFLFQQAWAMPASERAGMRAPHLSDLKAPAWSQKTSPRFGSVACLQGNVSGSPPHLRSRSRARAGSSDFSRARARRGEFPPEDTRPPY